MKQHPQRSDKAIRTSKPKRQTEPKQPAFPQPPPLSCYVEKDVDDPSELARDFLHTCYSTLAAALSQKKRRLIFWRQQWYRWEGEVWRPFSDDDIAAEVTQFVTKVFEKEAIVQRLSRQMEQKKSGKTDEQPPPKAKKVYPGLVAAVLMHLKAKGRAYLPTDKEPNSWLCKKEDRPLSFPASQIVNVGGVLLHLPSLRPPFDAPPGLYSCPATPEFFSFTKLGVKVFDPRAPKPKHWDRFLRQLWPNDPESIAALQEMFGYLLLSDNSQQKMFMLIGPPRSGKGTIGRLITALIGKMNVANPGFSDLGDKFTMSGFVGKTLAVISDALPSPRMDMTRAVETIQRITGEDDMDVERKYKDRQSMRLPIRFLLMTNEVPRLPSTSGALAKRSITLRLTESFYGREDHALDRRLAKELPGIFLWAVEGYHRLRERGHFVQPKTGEQFVRDMEELGNPVKAFVAQRCVVKPLAEVAVVSLYAAFRRWCVEKGIKHHLSEQLFGRSLRAAVAKLEVEQRRQGDGRYRVYVGIDRNC